MNKTKKLLAIVLLSCFSAGCAGSTYINSTPSGATVFIDGQQQRGETPTYHWDRGISGTSHKIRLEKDGYKPVESRIAKDQFSVGHCIMSIVLWPPLYFYWFGYPYQYSYTLEPIKK
jgi:hypothetical protein